ncbi:hypothetical protein DPMN_159745 [Dreissena polymorpha]|uniref:Uncharacterized protein n=1 Tax=Dreissena polymorpha TaxID=45954 RepID=A0A9D4ELH7_DREPO|nr:hypothetical protein DPMN_159745 [Dreissena polymorpha]
MSIGTLKNNGRIGESAKDKAEMLDEQFGSVFTKEDLDNIPKERLFTTSNHSKYPSYSTRSVTLH